MLIPAIPNSWIIGSVAALVAVVSGTIGYKIADTIADARIARAEERRMECEHARTEDAKRAAEETAALLSRALSAEQRVAQEIAIRHKYNARLKEMRRHGISKLASGNDCMSAPLRLYLNAAIAEGNAVSQGAADAAGADAPATSDTSGSATDADIAAWVIDAAGLYNDCRARIDAIRQWDEEVADGR